MNYGPSIADAYRQVGIYAGPDSQGREAGRPAGACGPPNSISCINLKTAKALGLVIPPMVLALADEVIE